MSMPANVLRLHCNNRKSDFVEIGCINPENVEPNEIEVYTELVSNNETTCVNLSRAEICVLARRILAEYEPLPVAVTNL